MADEVGIVLLPTGNWHYNRPSACDQKLQTQHDPNTLFPSLWDHLNSLISVYQSQDFTPDDMTVYIAVHISYIYLYSDDPWVPGSEANLLPENRQLHLDRQAGKFNIVAAAAAPRPVVKTFHARGDLTSPVLQQYYGDVRDLVRKGEHQPAMAAGESVNRPPPPVKFGGLSRESDEDLE